MKRKRSIKAIFLSCIVVLVLFFCYLTYLYQHPIWEGNSKNWSARYYYTLPMKKYTGELYWKGSKKITIKQVSFYENGRRETNINDKMTIRTKTNFVDMDDEPSDKTSLKVLVRWGDDGKIKSESIKLNIKRIYKPYYIFNVD